MDYIVQFSTKEYEGKTIMSYSNEVSKWRNQFVEKFANEAADYRPYTENGDYRIYSDAKEAAMLIMRHAATYQRLQEEECNGRDDIYSAINWHTSDYLKRLYDTDRAKWQAAVDLSNRRQALWEKRLQHHQELIERRITQLCAQFGFSATFQGDPRGATVKIVFPDGSYDDWAQEGWCVPTNNR